MKDNKLHRVNKHNAQRWNRPLFMPEKNLFKKGGGFAGIVAADKAANPWDYADDMDAATQFLGTQRGQDYANSKNAFGISKADNPFSKMNISGGLGAMAKTSIGAAGLGAIGGIGNKLAYNAISGGLSSGAGAAVGNLTNVVGGALSNVNPVLGTAVQVVGGAIGGGINALVGEGLDEEKDASNKQATNAYRNFVSNAQTTDALSELTAQASYQNAHSGGVFKKGDAAEKNASDKFAYDQAKAFAQNSLINNANNIFADQVSNAEREWIGAYGGLMGNMNDENTYDMGGAIDYGLAMDNLNLHKQAIQNKNKMSGLMQPPAFMPQPQGLFAFGGDAQTHGADFPTGLMHIDAGLSHEMNPNDGVQMGVDSEGTPNLVEEGEVVYNDYVFSNRITLDDEAKASLHFPKKKDMTYADAAKKLEKEIAERPNDPISEAGFKAQMEKLEENQERQKAEMEAARAREAFEALSPEEQIAIMQQAAQQEAMQQEAMLRQAQQPQGQVSPEEAAMMQQQMMQADDSQEPQMAACGGKLYNKGGVLDLLKRLGYKTVADAEKAGWKPSDFGKYENWNDINANSKLSDDFEWTDEFSNRLTAPDQKAALVLGWNPMAETVGRRWYEGDNGNNVGWSESYGKDKLNAKEFKEYVDRYKNTLGWAIENGIIKAPEGNATISMADVAKAMSQAPDWKATDNWLYSDIANQAKYLGMARGLNPDNDTKFINKWSPYGTFSKGEDGQWSYTLNPNLTNAQKQAFTDQFRKARTDNRIGVMYNNFQDPGASTNRYLLDEEGNPTLITTDDLSGYDQLGEYTWGNPEDNINNTAVFYRAKNAADVKPEAAKTPEEKVEEFKNNVKPKYQKGLFGIEDAGPLVALGMQAMGIGRSDTSGLDAAASTAGNYTTAKWMPIDTRVKYQPNDPWFYTMPIIAQSNATTRAINNSGSNQGSKEAAHLANMYNTTVALGNATRQQLDSNYDRYMKARQLRGSFEEANQKEYGVTSRFNAGAYNDANRTSAQMKMQSAAQRLAADRDWYGSMYGNINNLFQGLGARKKENRSHNMIADMAANGIFGVITPDSPMGQRYLEWANSSAEGGKVKRKKNKKRGLTY